MTVYINSCIRCRNIPGLPACQGQIQMSPLHTIRILFSSLQVQAGLLFPCLSPIYNDYSLYLKLIIINNDNFGVADNFLWYHLVQNEKKRRKEGTRAYFSIYISADLNLPMPPYALTPRSMSSIDPVAPASL